MIKMIKAPALLSENDNNSYKIFFAGSIDNGSAIDWQAKVFKDLKKLVNGLGSTKLKQDIVCISPRRDNWGPPTEEKMIYQIIWELSNIDRSDLVIVYFADDSKSPITFLELGTLLANNKNIIIYCSDKFYRYNNVKITSEHYSKSITETYKDFLDNIVSEIDYSLLQ